MNRQMPAVVTIVAAIALAGDLGFKDGREHRNPPAADSKAVRTG